MRSIDKNSRAYAERPKNCYTDGQRHNKLCLQAAKEKTMHEEELCPKCQGQIIEDVAVGRFNDIRVETKIWYCRKCLYRFDSSIDMFRITTASTGSQATS